MEPEATPPTERLGGDLKTRQHILLNSNEPPLDSEVVIVQSAIVKADGRLAWLANEISQLRDRLQRLEEEQVSLSSFRAQNRAILSPLRRMPPEVLSEIFAWASPLAKLRKMRITDSPWLFTHVSRRWRAVAILNPSLWSLVVISCHSGPDQSPCYPTAMVETQVSRAHTLKVHFHGCETSDSRPQLEMFRSLTKHASRWEELGLTLTSFLVPLLADLRGRLPLLRRLWIQCADQASQEAEESIQCFQTAPSLAPIALGYSLLAWS
ncbi:hypothetical protein DFH06DRAFT_1485820 [Mycena polygramma]|nr:hypothetical protein DFH06DRAFT_1485820 [Mycena polygramma]